jgi:membrane fusion protein, multidrug efflux system
MIPLALLASLAACSGGGDEKQGDRPAPLVRTDAARPMRFVERIDAVGTARANEQVTVAAPVTERIIRLNFDDGAYVREGQTLAVLAQAEESAQLSEAQARAREARQQLERIDQLKARGFATNSSLDAQSALAAQAGAQAAQVRAAIGDRVVRAPFSGWVSLRNISEGAIVSAGTEIATVSDVSRIKLDFTVPETVLSSIRTGQTIAARSAAWPNQEFRGTISTIDPVIDPNTRAVMVRAVLPNSDRKLKPGMLLTVGIETAPRTSLSVPELAVVGEGDQRFVYIVGEDNVAKRAQVRTGVRSEGRIEIVEGLRPGQPVVTEGVVKLAEGMKVRLAGEPAGQRAADRGGDERPRSKG